MASAPGGLIEFEGDHIVAVAAPIVPTDLPAPVARLVDMTIPDGVLVECVKVWRGEQVAYRIAKRYPADVPGNYRTITADAEAAILERTHQIDPALVDALVLQAAKELALGAIERIEVVQGAPGHEGYRVSLVRADGARFIVSLMPGRRPRVQRVAAAELRIAQ